MSELDVAKTRIAYYQVWLGILLVTDLSVAGWFVSNLDEADASFSPARSSPWRS